MGQLFRRALGWSLCILGGLLLLFGFWAVGAYVWGVIAALSEPDQSWIFWGLAILVIGLAAIGAGIGVTMVGLQLLRDQKPR